MKVCQRICQRNKWMMILFLAAIALAASGCGGGAKGGDGEGQGASQASLETIDKPVTLKIYAPMADEQFAKFFAEPIAKKFPSVSLERLHGQGGGAPGAQALLNAGTPPDIVYALPGWYGKEKLMDLYADLTPLIRKYNFDLNRFEPVVADTMKTYSPEGTIDFLPESMTTLVLIYNKAIFDKFGVPYPKEGITWDDFAELVRKVSRTVDGKTYYGFNMDKFFPINNNQLSLAFVDPKTNKASVRNEGWQKYFNTMKQLFEIEGNKLKAGQFGNYNMFSKDQNVAMMASRLEQISSFILAQESGLDWDMTSVPTFKDAPGTGTQVNAPFLAITPTSPYKDEAFKIIAYLLSDEVQLEHNKDGRLTVLKDENIRSQFGKNIKELAGKNIQAALALKPAKPRTFTLYDDYVVTSLADGFVSVITGQKDVNTALKDSEEAANRTIEENKR
jgi:multiple sugar transport system substrate-binding protein